ncbi:hypothetical protein GGF31_007639 [Allomyces arbusculus]|nr:hypothetical protein GGF31_007639 [Allomyces arbusculus]
MADFPPTRGSSRSSGPDPPYAQQPQQQQLPPPRTRVLSNPPRRPPVSEPPQYPVVPSSAAANDAGTPPPPRAASRDNPANEWPLATMVAAKKFVPGATADATLAADPYGGSSRSAGGPPWPVDQDCAPAQQYPPQHPQSTPPHSEHPTLVPSVTALLHSYVGEHVGPPPNTRFHRVDAWRRAVQLIATIAIIGGSSFFVSLLVCVLASIGYATFKVNVGDLAALIVFGFTAYAYCMVAMCRTALRTAARIIVWVWANTTGVPGGSDNGECVDNADTERTARARLLAAVQPKKLAFDYPTLVFFVTVPGRVAGAVRDSMVDALVDCFYPRNGKRQQKRLQRRATRRGAASADAEDLERDRRDLHAKVSRYLSIAAAVAVFVVPCMAVAVLYGYYAIVSILAVAFVGIAACMVIAVNALNRMFRTLRFTMILWKNLISPERRRAMYVASVGQDSRINILDSLTEQALKISTFVLMIGIVFVTNSRTTLLISLGGVIAVLAIFRLRSILCCCFYRSRQRKHAPHKPPPVLDHDGHAPVDDGDIDDPEESSYYTGAGTRVPIIVFTARLVCCVVGLTALALTDFADVQTSATNGPGLTSTLADLFKQQVKPGGVPVSRPKLFGYLGAFVTCYLAHDIALFVTKIPARAAALVVMLSYAGKVTFSALIVNQYIGLLSSAVVMLTYLSFDLRDGRAQWTARGFKRRSHSQRRARINAMLTVALLLGGILLSTIVGFLVGSTQSRTSTAGIDPTFTPTTMPYPYCTAKPYASRFRLVDMVTLAGAAYKPTVAAATAFIKTNSALADVTVAFDNVDDPKGVRFWEFQFTKSPGVSVVAIRGTSSMEDVLQDLHLFSTPLVLQASSYFGTLVSLWPRTVVAQVVHWVARYVAFSNFVYSQEVEARTARLVGQDVNITTTGVGGNTTMTTVQRQVVLVGHSLGGAVAQVIGSRLGVPALGVSSPGLGFSYLNFGTTLEKLTEWGTNIVPFSDPVPMCDEQVSTVVHLPCYQSVPSNCHKWRSTLRTLIDLCSGVDPAGNAT